jgi:hypothetical protein
MDADSLRESINQAAQKAVSDVSNGLLDDFKDEAINQAVGIFNEGLSRLDLLKPNSSSFTLTPSFQFPLFRTSSIP